MRRPDLTSFTVMKLGMEDRPSEAYRNTLLDLPGGPEGTFLEGLQDLERLLLDPESVRADPSPAWAAVRATKLSPSSSGVLNSTLGFWPFLSRRPGILLNCWKIYPTIFLRVCASIFHPMQGRLLNAELILRTLHETNTPQHLSNTFGISHNYLLELYHHTNICLSYIIADQLGTPVTV